MTSRTTALPTASPESTPRVRALSGSGAPLGRIQGPRAAPSPCAVCHTTIAHPVRLERATGPGNIEVCSRCLRSAMRRQADVSQDRNRLLLEDYADEHGLALWRTQDVFYVMPASGPFAPDFSPTAV